MPDDYQKALIYPADIKIIDSVETLRVVADPLRLRLLARLRQGPATAKDLAKALDSPLKGLYYHLAILEEHDLIRVHATRIVSGIIEKQYAATAYRLSVDRALFDPEPAEGTGLEVFLSFVLDHARAEILRSVAAGLIAPHAPTPHDKEGGLDLGRIWMRLTPEQRQELDDRVHVIHMEYAANQAAPDDPAAQYYEFLIGIYPVIAPPERGEEPEP
jgi:DNA-binding transcriptional ArsR family regulator